MTSQELTEKITELIFSKKGFDLKILDLRELTPISDYFIICSADSDIQVKAIADEIDNKLHSEGIRLWHKEGYKSLNWVLLDYVDVVVHVFKKSVREFYNLERLWGDAPVKEVTDTVPEKKTTPRTRQKKSSQ